LVKKRSAGRFDASLALEPGPLFAQALLDDRFELGDGNEGRVAIASGAPGVFPVHSLSGFDGWRDVRHTGSLLST
jgi:hypothetical protein